MSLSKPTASLFQDTVTYQIISDNNNGLSFGYLYMDEKTGVIYPRKPLSTVDNSIPAFTVSLYNTVC